MRSRAVASPVVSIVIPVHNEEKALPGTLERLAREPGDVEIIVADGGSTDGTVAIVQARAGVRLVSSPKGRAAQMNAGAALARGDWLLFLHADTLLPRGALARLEALSCDARCRAGGFRQRFSGTRWPLRLISWLTNVRCRVTRIVYGDQALFVRRDLFRELGGFPDTPILEDVLFGEKLRQVTRPRLLDAYVLTDSRRFERQGIAASFARVLLILACHKLGVRIRGRAFFDEVR